MKTMTLREKVEAVLNDESIPTYRIAKGSGVWVNSITRVRGGGGKVGNIRLEIAEKIAAYYDTLHKGE